MKRLIKRILAWSTTKKSLYFALVFFGIYTALNLLLNWKGVSVDETLTERVFDLLETLVIAGGALSGAKIVKGEEKGVE